VSDVKTIDFRNTIVPFALLDMCNHFKGMDADETMEILGVGLSLRSAIFRIIPESARCLVAEEKIKDAEPVFRIRLRKKTGHTDKQHSSCRMRDAESVNRE